MSSDKSTNKDLYEHLQSTIDNDKIYWIRNEAKIRASQTSKSYEEFRDIVAAAHLTPLTKQDMSKKQSNVK